LNFNYVSKVTFYHNYTYKSNFYYLDLQKTGQILQQLNAVIGFL
jgi:hypothetical protein